MTDTLDAHDRAYLDKLRLAVEVLIRAAEETDAVNGVLESELHLLRDSLEREILRSPGGS
jgi:hypothetical protein